MRKVIKIIIIILIVLVVLAGGVYLDYFNTKANNTSPKISFKEETEDYILYKAILYRVWYCKTNRKNIIGSYSEDAICPKNYVYEDGYYTNTAGVKISKRDLQLLANDGVYTSEMIEDMDTNKKVESAVHVAYNFGVNKFKEIDSEKDYKIVVFPTFEEKDDLFSWVYDEEDKENYYCLKGEKYNYSIAKYTDGKCGKYEKIKMDKEWCADYTNSTLTFEEGITSFCEE